MKFKQVFAALLVLLVVANTTLVSGAFVAQATQSPVGYTDFANCERIAGWAFDPDISSAQIAIHVYQDNPAGSGVFLGAGETIHERPDVNAAYAIIGNHGFSIPMPDSAKDGKSHNLYVYGIDISGDPHAFLNKVEMPACSLPVNFDAPAPVPAPIPAPTPISFDAPTPTPSPITRHAPIGYLEAADCFIIGGWAFDQDTSLSPISVHIYKDGPAGSGTLVASAQTSGTRSDVNTAYAITGTHGFTITTPDSLKDGKSHTIYAYGIDSAGVTNAQLNSVQTMSACSDPVAASTPTPVPTVTPTPTAIPFDAPTPTPSPIGGPIPFGGPTITPIPITRHAPIGYLDAADCSMIAGWAFDSDTSSSAIAIHIYKDGPAGSGTLMATETLGLRPDVNTAYAITGNHGFKITTPDSFKDGKSHSVHAYAIDSTGGTNTLIGSQTFSCSRPIDPILTNTRIRNTVGYLDVVDCKVIGGWAYDPDHPNDQVSVKIEAIPTVNMADPSQSNKNPGATLMETTTGLRPDVNAAFGITGNHGFTIVTPDSLKNGGRYGFSATAYDLDAPAGSAPIALVGSVFNFSCPAPVTGPHADPVATIISIRAKGTSAAEAYPLMELRSGGLMLNAWHVTKDYADYTVAIPSALSDNIRIYFTNDHFTGSEDRNLIVDSVAVNGKTYQTEDATTYAKGVYVSGQGCVGGFQKGESLHCNGYFEYPTLKAVTVSALSQTFGSLWNIFR